MQTRTGSDHKDDLTAQHTCRSVKSRQWEDKNCKYLNDDDLLKSGGTPGMITDDSETF